MSLHPDLAKLLPYWLRDVEMTHDECQAWTVFALAVARAERERCAEAVDMDLIDAAAWIRNLPDPDWTVTP